MCIRDRDIAIKKCETVFDKIRYKNIEKIPVLQKSGIYKLKCKDCNKVYLGETGRKFACKLSDHKRGEGNRTTNSLYARHFIEDNHKFLNPLADCEIVKVINNTVERKLREELSLIHILLYFVLYYIILYYISLNIYFILYCNSFLYSIIIFLFYYSILYFFNAALLDLCVNHPFFVNQEIYLICFCEAGSGHSYVDACEGSPTRS